MPLDFPRALLTALYRAAVEGAAPLPRTRDAVARWLTQHADALAPDARVHVFALGKAAPAMAAGAVRALDAHGLSVTSGVVVAAQPRRASDDPDTTLPGSIAWRVGDHPVPGPASLAAADALEHAVRRVEPGDLALVLLSGGTTALAAAPVSELEMAVDDIDRAQTHIANLAETLLESGLAIHEMNAIRRRVLRWGAGRLAVALAEYGAAHIPVFAISDVVGDDPAVIGSGPCTPDPFDDASFLALIDAHGVRSGLERTMGRFLGVLGGGEPPEVPAASHPAFQRVTYELVARNRDAVDALADAARRAGVDDVVVEELPLTGDAASLGDLLARRALRSIRNLPPGARALFVAGGEPVVHLRATFERAWQDGEADEARLLAEQTLHTDVLGDVLGGDLIPLHAVSDEPMRGGRMQLLAITAALALEEAVAGGDRAAARITLLAAGTDGRDGPTDAAGAIVDAAVPALARRHGRDAERDARTGRSYYPLDAAGALLRPGQTGTNVMDVVAILLDGGPV